MVEMGQEREQELLADLTDDHEKYMGAEIPDPWDDDEQTDWPSNREEVSDGVGTDQESGSPD